jgi:two-component system, response regulator
MSGSDAIDILLVEDNATDAELCMRALRNHNLVNHVTWVRDGAAALDLLFPKGDRAASNQAIPRLILLDLRLPKVSGLEVLRRIKAAERTRAVPVVVMTSSKEDRDALEAYSLGVNSFVSKPMLAEEFMKVTAELGCYWLLTNHLMP